MYNILFLLDCRALPPQQEKNMFFELFWFTVNFVLFPYYFAAQLMLFWGMFWEVLGEFLGGFGGCFGRFWGMFWEVWGRFWGGLWT